MIYCLEKENEGVPPSCISFLLKEKKKMSLDELKDLQEECTIAENAKYTLDNCESELEPEELVYLLALVEADIEQMNARIALLTSVVDYGEMPDGKL